MDSGLAAFCLLSLIHFSIQTSVEEGADAISDARMKADQRLKEALKNADPSFVKHLSGELWRLEAAGRGDMKAIGDFKGPGDRDLAIANSIIYWQGRMENFIQVYVQQPESFADVKYEGENTGPPDPNNDTPEYKKAEAEINGVVEKAVRDAENRYAEVIQGEPSDVGKVTAWSARREGARQALDAAIAEFRRQGQFSKRQAARGDTEGAFNNLRNHLEASRANFETNLKDIFAQNPV